MNTDLSASWFAKAKWRSCVQPVKQPAYKSRRRTGCTPYGLAVAAEAARNTSASHSARKWTALSKSATSEHCAACCPSRRPMELRSIKLFRQLDISGPRADLSLCDLQGLGTCAASSKNECPVI